MENKKEWIEFLLGKSKFKLTEEEKTKFEKDLDVFVEQLKYLDEFNLEGVHPQVAPFQKKENILRDDETYSSNKSDIILDNASKVKNGYIFLEKEDK